MEICRLELREGGKWDGKVSFVDAYFRNGEWHNSETHETIERILIFSRN